MQLHMTMNQLFTKLSQKNHIKKVATKNDIVAMIGAGDVNKICDILLKK